VANRIVIAVVGGGSAGADMLTAAETVGRKIAERGAMLVCGGLGGIMEAAAKGAKSAGGTTIGILPQPYRHDANPYIDVPIATGFGEGRNVFIIRTADVVIAVGGEYGTLSEIALALKSGKAVIGLGTWDIKGILKADSPEHAVDLALTHV